MYFTVIIAVKQNTLLYILMENEATWWLLSVLILLCFVVCHEYENVTGTHDLQRLISIALLLL